jgi:hypothetical protein
VPVAAATTVPVAVVLMNTDLARMFSAVLVNALMGQSP